jgi:hypothetical protein
MNCGSFGSVRGGARFLMGLAQPCQGNTEQQRRQRDHTSSAFRVVHSVRAALKADSLVTLRSTRASSTMLFWCGVKVLFNHSVGGPASRSVTS